MRKQALSKRELESLVLKAAVGEWGCEDLTGVTVEHRAAIGIGRNWTVTHLQNADLHPAAERTVERIVEKLAQQFELGD
jgi:hypothetical protein